MSGSENGLADTDRLFLRGPKEGEIDPFAQGLSGEFWRLVTCGDRIDDLWRQERQTYQSSDIAG